MNQSESGGRKEAKRRERGVFEKAPDSGVWWVRYTDAHGKLHREKVGPRGLAKQVYQKRKTEIREGRFFPQQPRQRPAHRPLARLRGVRQVHRPQTPATPVRHTYCLSGILMLVLTRTLRPNALRLSIDSCLILLLS